MLVTVLGWVLLITRDLLTPMESFMREQEFLYWEAWDPPGSVASFPSPALADGCQNHGLYVGQVSRWKGANAFFLFCPKQRWECPLGVSWWRGIGIRTEGTLFARPQWGCRGGWGVRISGPSKSSRDGLSLYVHVTSRITWLEVFTWKKHSVSKLITAITHILWHMYVFLVSTCAAFYEHGWGLR